MINYVELDINKSEFLESKIDGKLYTDIGNFGKHLKRHGYSLASYTLKFYKDKVPICIETNSPSNYKLKGYWNRWYPITYSNRKLIGITKNYLRKLETIKLKNAYSIYLELDYWIDKFPKYSERLSMVNWLIDSKYYLRLLDNYYDDNWTSEGKQKYIESILEKSPILLKNTQTLEGFILRGNNLEDAKTKLIKSRSTRKPFKWTTEGLLYEGYSLDEIPDILSKYYKNKPCSFRNKEIQKSNIAKKLAKYSGDEMKLFSVRCKEYWMRKGYNLEESLIKVNESQKLNTISSIMQRLNCTEYEAREVQKEIYSRRLITMSEKSVEELADIRRRQDSGSFEYCLRKCNFNDTEANILYSELLRKRCTPFGRASKESLKYFIPLYKFLRHVGINREDMYFGVTGSNEYGIYDKVLRKYKFYDFTILSKKLIIEYDGMFWHSSEDAILNDEYKTKLAYDNGFKLLRIKSNDDIHNNKIKINEFIEKEISIKLTDW